MASSQPREAWENTDMNILLMTMQTKVWTVYTTLRSPTAWFNFLLSLAALVSCRGAKVLTDRRLHFLATTLCL
jgi:hypothetical protein